MTDATVIGLPPPADAPPAERPSSAALWRARALNLFGLVSPAANLGLVYVAPKDRKWFGLGAGVFCLLVAWHSVNANRMWLATAAVSVHYALVLAGLIHPLWVAKIGDAWAAFGMALGKVMAYPVFTVIYFLVVTPTALLVRAFGKDPLGRNAPRAETYWTPHEPPAKEKYERQF